MALHLDPSGSKQALERFDRFPNTMLERRPIHFSDNVLKLAAIQALWQVQRFWFVADFHTGNNRFNVFYNLAHISH